MLALVAGAAPARAEPPIAVPFDVVPCKPDDAECRNLGEISLRVLGARAVAEPGLALIPSDGTVTQRAAAYCANLYASPTALSGGFGVASVIPTIIGRAYGDSLGRAPTSAELEYWSNGKACFSTIVNANVSWLAAEAQAGARTEAIKSAYWDAFDRWPTGAELTHWGASWGKAAAGAACGGGVVDRARKLVCANATWLSSPAGAGERSAALQRAFDKTCPVSDEPGVRFAWAPPDEVRASQLAAFTTALAGTGGVVRTVSEALTHYKPAGSSASGSCVKQGGPTQGQVDAALQKPTGVRR